MAESDNEKWLEGAEQYAAPLEDWQKVPTVDEESIDDTMSLPGVQYNMDPTRNNRAVPVGFVQLHLGSLFRKIASMLSTVTSAVAGIAAAEEAAEEAAEAANTAAAGAENVDADLDGMTVIVTNRAGQTKSVDLSIDFYETYGSVAEMRADIANIPRSALVTIATDDPIDDENARVYQRRSDGTLKYLFDLDQKSAAAWADWLNNKKPLIEAAISQASDDHTQHLADHGVYGQDHAQASDDHTQHLADHGTAEADHTRAEDDHTQAHYDHNTADTDHGVALSDHGVALSDHNTADGDHQTFLQDHQAATDDHTTYESDHRTFLSDHQASEQATADANAAATDASGIYQTVTGWFDGESGFMATADGWLAAVQSSWNAFWPSAKNAWDAFFGTSASDENGVRKIWSDWYGARQSQWSEWWAARQQDASNFSVWFTARQNEWTAWFTNGVVTTWENLRRAVVKATDDADKAASAANTQAAYAKEQGDYAKEEGDRSKNMNDNPWDLRDDGYIWVYDETSGEMVRTSKMIIGFDDLTEQQQQSIINAFVLKRASVATCEAIVDELV